MKKSVVKKKVVSVKQKKVLKKIVKKAVSTSMKKVVKKVIAPATKTVAKTVGKKNIPEVADKNHKSVSPTISSSSSLVITAALPYANGAIHIGHLLEYIQADMYARFWRLLNRDVLYICASDMHGTPIEVNAAKEGMKPEVFVEKYWREHQADFKTFLIQFDEYYKTHSPENKELAEMFYTVLKKKGFIYHKKMAVMFCDNCNRSLPDRFVKGGCSKCQAADQYGDVCESCGSVLKSFDLIKPYCVICKHAPVRKEKEHYFFKLSAFNAQLQAWLLSSSGLQSEVKNWLQEWMDKGLEDWCISREAPYFGFEIPGCREEIGEVRYFYVWLDAPIGYISATKHYCEKRFGVLEGGKRWEKYWYKGDIQHFIGKDIAYFHFLFWPAMLMAMGISMPNLTVHGFITVNGQKMSKSRGTFFTARDFAALYPVEGLRFYYASHLDRKLVDVDLNFEELKAVNNNVLMGSLGNFCYRVLTFAVKNYGEVAEVAEEKALNALVNGLVADIEKAYIAQDFKLAVRGILQIADVGNSYFQQSEVWKNKDAVESKRKVGWCVNLARVLSVVSSPILPEFSLKIQHVFGDEVLLWRDVSFGWRGKLGEVPLLVKKIELVEEKAQFPLRMMVGEITSVRNHPNADSLYLLSVDFGADSGFTNGGVRQVVAGLKKFLKIEELQGRKVVFCVNMKPAKLRGEMSEAMVLAADDGAHLGLLQFKDCAKGDEVVFEGTTANMGEVGYEEFAKLKIELSGSGVGKNVVYEGRKLKSVRGGVEVTVTVELKDGARVK